MSIPEVLQIGGDSVAALAGAVSVATALPTLTGVSAGLTLKWVAVQARRASAGGLDTFDAASFKIGLAAVVVTAVNGMILRPEDGVGLLNVTGQTHIAAIRTGAAIDLSVVVTPLANQ